MCWYKGNNDQEKKKNKLNDSNSGVKYIVVPQPPCLCCQKVG